MNNTTFIGTPYFPASVKNGKGVSICPACGEICRNSGKHWAAAKHQNSDVTPESDARAHAIAEELMS